MHRDTARSPFALTSHEAITQFRIAVDKLSETVSCCAPESVESSIQEGLADAAITTVLQAAAGDGTRHRALDDLAQRATTFQPTRVSSARDVGALVRVELLSALDAAWWSHVPPYRTDDQIRADVDLVDLRSARRHRDLRFGFRVQVFDPVRRALRAADRRALPHRSPRTIGMRLPYGRPEMIGVLNSLADDLAARAPGAPQIWVNSLVRSLAYQDEMRSSGYTAATGSAHCVGWAADIEMAWMKHNGYGNALADLLIERAHAAEFNVIDEGQAWHICLNPAMTTGGSTCAESR
ncbi:MAG: hypothetical protein WAW85_08185 [Gordonia sp. (in: high G+C Gram-positive bacteria)]|uniref:hypothetical protein n=1 Tax=Gordonia sp. (in: high G+C Gram-positive bacteria) TaxID=84139 RepID=UPI003BB7B553